MGPQAARPANKSGHIGGSGKDGEGVREKRGGEKSLAEKMVSGAQKKEVLSRIIAPTVRAGRRRVQADAVAIAA